MSSLFTGEIPKIRTRPHVSHLSFSLVCLACLSYLPEHQHSAIPDHPSSLSFFFLPPTSGMFLWPSVVSAYTFSPLRVPPCPSVTLVFLPACVLSCTCAHSHPICDHRCSPYPSSQVCLFFSFFLHFALLALGSD